MVHKEERSITYSWKTERGRILQYSRVSDDVSGDVIVDVSVSVLSHWPVLAAWYWLNNRKLLPEEPDRRRRRVRVTAKNEQSNSTTWDIWAKDINRPSINIFDLGTTNTQRRNLFLASAKTNLTHFYQLGKQILDQHKISIMVRLTETSPVNKIFVFIFLYLKISAFLHRMFKIWSSKEDAD